MVRADVFAMLKASGLPVTYRTWGEAVPPPLPYVAYFYIGDSDLAADDSNYCEVARWCAELYSEDKDDESEAAIVTQLKNKEIPYSKNEIGPIDGDRFMVAFYFTTIGGGNNA